MNPTTIKQLAPRLTRADWMMNQRMQQAPTFSSEINKHAGTGVRTAIPGMLCLFLLGGCFQTPAPQGSPTLREAMRLENSASPQRAQVAPAPVREDLARALRLYSLVDDTAGAIRTHLGLAHLHEQHAQPEPARREARIALQLARELGDPGYLYRALLTVGRVDNNPEMFEQALGYAGSSLQRAVLLTYLGRPAEAADLVGAHTEPGRDEVADLAFVLFAHAQHALDRTAAERALALYKRADDYHGIARSLRLIARIAAEAGNITEAERYRARAQRVESALRQTPANTPPSAGKPAR